MALFIRDAEMDALAEARRTLPLKDRLAHSKALADAMGPGDPTFDMKAYSDEMWEGGSGHRGNILKGLGNSRRSSGAPDRVSRA